MKIPDNFHLTHVPSHGPPVFGFGLLGEAVFRRTYPRPMGHGVEDWGDVCLRVVEGCLGIRKHWLILHGLPWDESYWQAFGSEMYSSLYQMHWMPAGRGLWMMGSDYMRERGSMPLNNCAYVEITSESWIDEMCWGFNALMNGAGVGFGLQLKPKIWFYKEREEEGTYVIPDSREGWVNSVQLLLQRLTKEGMGPPKMDYSAIRPYGEPIRGFGGKASGPGPLMILHHRLRGYVRAVINTGSSLAGTEFLANVANAIGQCVVSGNVRRGAEILLGHPDDQEFLALKNRNSSPLSADLLAQCYRDVFEVSKTDYDRALAVLVNSVTFDEDWREADRMVVGGLSNNTVVLSESDHFLQLPDLAESIRDHGEPGIFNLINAQRYGRMGEELADSATGLNPCGEQPLESRELCNLVEVFPTRVFPPSLSRKLGHPPLPDLKKAIQFAALYAQTVSLLPTEDEGTNEVIARNRRIGIGIGGFADWLDQLGAARLTRECRNLYRLVQDCTDKFADETGVPPPIRTTTVKPSGTISLLAGVNSGLHRSPFRYAIRRVRMDPGTILAEQLGVAGVPHEPDKVDPSAEVFEFPTDQGPTRPATAVSGWEQLAFLAMVQREWADAAPSATIYVQPGEVKDIEHMLAQFAPLVKSLSMKVHTYEGEYEQMPYEGIESPEYERRMRELSPLPSAEEGATDTAQAAYCDSDSCLV